MLIYLGLYQLCRVLCFCGQGDMLVPAFSWFLQSSAQPFFSPLLPLLLAPVEIVYQIGIMPDFSLLGLTLLF